MSTSLLETMLLESDLDPGLADDLAPGLRGLDELAAPAPSAALAALLDGPPAEVTALRPSRGARARRSVVGAVVLAVSTVGATGLSAAANTLPAPWQSHLATFSQHYLPFHFPQPRTLEHVAPPARQVVPLQQRHPLTGLPAHPAPHATVTPARVQAHAAPSASAPAVQVADTTPMNAHGKAKGHDKRASSPGSSGGGAPAQGADDGDSQGGEGDGGSPKSAAVSQPTPSDPGSTAAPTTGASTGNGNGSSGGNATSTNNGNGNGAGAGKGTGPGTGQAKGAGNGNGSANGNGNGKAKGHDTSSDAVVAAVVDDVLPG